MKFPLKKISSVERRSICLRRRTDVYSPSIEWENIHMNILSSLCLSPSLSLWKVFIFAGFSYGQESNTYTKLNTLIHSHFSLFLCSQNKMLYCWLWYELHSIDTIIQYKCFCILLTKLSTSSFAYARIENKLHLLFSVKWPVNIFFFQFHLSFIG